MIAHSEKLNYTRILYVSFTVFAVVQMIAYQNALEGLPMLGIALAFDPFDPKMKFNDRPMAQRILLIAHVSIFFCLLGYELVTKVIMK